MIPEVGMIIAAYTIARLLQVPLERSAWAHRDWALWTISLLAIVYIAWFAAGIWFSGVGGAR